MNETYKLPRWSRDLAFQGILVVSLALAGVFVAEAPHRAFEALAAVLAAAVLFFRPKIGLLLLLTCFVASGRAASHIRFGSTYVAEVSLAIFLLALLANWHQPRRGTIDRLFVAAMTALFLAALVALVSRTHMSGLVWARNLAIVYYGAYAIIARQLVRDSRFLKQLFGAITVGSTLAAILVFTGHSGPSQDLTTSTGAVRIAHTSYIAPMGLAPLAILAAVQAGMVGRRWLLATAPFLAGLVLLNYRSSWIAFLLAVAALYARRPGKLVVSVVVGATLGAVVLVLGIGTFAQTPLISNEVTRAGTIVDLHDPNARYRLEYWSNLIRPALREPIVGHGFDAYNPLLIPPRQTCRSGPNSCVDPHNSFVALAYRVGLIPVAILVCFLVVLTVRGVRILRTGRGEVAAAAGALTASAIYLGVFSAFNVGLELPYFAVPFWVTVGLLSAVISGTVRWTHDELA